MTPPGDVTSEQGPEQGPDQPAVPVGLRRVVVATLAPAVATLVVILLGTLVIKGVARGMDASDRSGGVVLVAVVLLVLALAALTAVVSAAALFGFLLPRGTRFRAVAGWLGACLAVALLSTRGWVPALVGTPLLTLVPLTALGRLRWWWAAGVAVAAVLAAVLSPLAGG
jgi:hypothetical protein